MGCRKTESSRDNGSSSGSSKLSRGMDDSWELRLLRCFLSGSRELDAHQSPEATAATAHEGVELGESDHGASGSSARGRSSRSNNIREGIEEVLCHIEAGSYLEALAFSRWWSVLLGEIPSAPSVRSEDGKRRNGAEEFYAFMESKIAAAAVACLNVEGGGDGSADHGPELNGAAKEEDEDERQHRAILLMGLGVAMLCAFMQANITGPTREQFPACPAFAAVKENEFGLESGDEEWDAWARMQLMADGCDILGKFRLPQYLLLSKLLLVHPAETRMARKGPRSRIWWAFRVLLVQQRVLAERSASLRSLLVAHSLDLTERFGTAEAISSLGWNWNLKNKEADSMAAAVHLEVGLMEHVYGHDDDARCRFENASDLCGLELSLVGVLGSRTRYQTDPKAQMVLVASSQSSKDDETDWLDFLDVSGGADVEEDNTAGKTAESDIHLAPKLVNAPTDPEGPLESTAGDQKILSSIEQAIILAMGVDVRKSNPDDELRSWQMAPFIEAVDVQPRTRPMVKAWCQLLRVRWEKTRARTRERSFLMMEQLANNVREGPSKVQQRMSFVSCVPFPILPALLEEYAELMLGFGLVGDAMNLFKELELWNKLIDCYCLLGKKTAAAGLIRERLEIQPEDPRLWCSLGDVNMDDNCYQKAWEASGHRFTRAQRSLARSAYQKGHYAEAVKHWDLALSLNPLHPDGWFALGSAALKVRDLDKALGAFTRQVQLDPENGESWNNIAAINMQKKRSKEAFVAFREALKFKRNSWQIWENFGQTALDTGNFGQAVLAVEKVLELSEDKRVDVVLLAALIKELEYRKGLSSRPGVATTNGEPEEELPPGEEGGGDDPSYSQESDGISTRSKETEALLENVGKLLSRVVVKASGGGEIWELKARWHRLKGDVPMYIEALLKQVRAYQGSKWQSNPDQFRTFARACLQLCDAYVECDGSANGGKRNLLSAQMLLRNTIKQAEHLKAHQQFQELVACLDKVEAKLEAFAAPHEESF